MKNNRKILFTAMSAISTLCAYAANDLNIGSIGADITGSINNINFTENGAVGTVSKDTTLNGNNITVGSGVNATITQASTTSQIRSTANLILSGANQDKSSLTLQNFSIDGGYSGGNPSFAYDISVQNLSVNLQRNNTSGVRITGNSVLLENSVITAKKKADNGTASTSDVELRTGLVSLSNSKLVVDSGATLKIGRDDSNFSGPVEINLNNSSLINNGGNFTMRRPSGGDYNLSLAGYNTFEGKVYSWTNTSFANGASLTLATKNQTYTLGTITLAENGSATISGSGIAKWTNSMVFKDSKALTITSNAEAGSIQLNSSTSKFTIGNGTDAIKYSGAIQIDNGTLIINDNVAVEGTFQVTQNAGQSKNVYIGNNSTITSKYSRITDAEIHGRIITNATSMTSNGWNYSLAFGAFSTTAAQKGDVILGANSSVYVAPTNSTYFGIYGKLEVNTLTAGALESTANAPLMIYKDSTITLNTTNAFKVGGATSQATSDFNFYADHSNINLIVNTDNNIGRFVYGSTLTEVALDIATGKTLTLGSVALASGVDEGIVALILGDNIERGMLKITDMDNILATYAGNNKIVFTDSLGSDRIIGENLFLENVDGDYWVYTVAVPEPAEWAMILGALALGFVAYRRRK